MAAQPKFKVVLSGVRACDEAGGPGSTALVVRMLKGEFLEKLSGTVGSSFFKLEREKCILEFWDTASQQRYHSLRSMYERGAQAVLLAVDLSVPVDRGVRSIMEAVKRVGDNCPAARQVLVGTKADLADAARMQELAEVARAAGIACICTSALTGSNCAELLGMIESLCLEEQRPEGESSAAAAAEWLAKRQDRVKCILSDDAL